VRRCVWSRKLKNEEPMTRVGSQRHRKIKSFVLGFLYTNLLTIYLTISLQLTIPEAVCTVMCSWWWAEEPPQTCRASVKINKWRKVASCWMWFGILSIWIFMHLATRQSRMESLSNSRSLQSVTEFAVRKIWYHQQKKECLINLRRSLINTY